MKPTLVILLDAFGSEYFGKSKYLKELGKEYSISKFETIFGYQAGDDAFFSGKYPEETNIWFNFIINRHNSIYKNTKYVLPIFKILDKINQKILHMGLPFIISKIYNMSYLWKLPQNMPLDLLPYVDIALKYHSADKRYHNENVFSLLRMHGEKYFIFISNVVFNENGYKIYYTKKGNDTTAKNLFLKYLNKKNKFFFVHLMGLDKIGHVHYTGKEVEDVIRKEEELIEEMMSEFFKVFPDGKFIIFGDHGMAPVKKIIDSNEILDFVKEFDEKMLYFIDSTFLRIYLSKKDTKYQIIKELKESFDLFIVDKEVSQKYKVPYDNRYGDIIISTKPYEIFYPNFFDTTIPKGMHGYTPEIPEAPGCLITNMEIERKDMISIPEFARMLGRGIK